MLNNKEKRLRVWCGEEIDEGSGVRILNFHIEMSDVMCNDLRGETSKEAFLSSLIEHLVKVVKREIIHSKGHPLRMGYVSQENFEVDLRSELERENERRLGRIQNQDLERRYLRGEISPARTAELMGGNWERDELRTRNMERERRLVEEARMRNRIGMESNIRPPISPVWDSSPMPKAGLWKRLKRYFFKKRVGFKTIWK